MWAEGLAGGGGPGGCRALGPLEGWPEPAQERLRPLQLLGLAGARSVAAEQLRNLFF